MARACARRMAHRPSLELGDGRSDDRVLFVGRYKPVGACAMTNRRANPPPLATPSRKPNGLSIRIIVRRRSWTSYHATAGSRCRVTRGRPRRWRPFWTYSGASTVVGCGSPTKPSPDLTRLRSSDSGSEGPMFDPRSLALGSPFDRRLACDTPGPVAAYGLLNLPCALGSELNQRSMKRPGNDRPEPPEQRP